MTDPSDADPRARLHHRLRASLYTDAMVLADETRTYIEHQGRSDGDTLDPIDRVLLSCEQLRMTTRLMTVMGWLLTWRAVEAGELNAGARRLDDLPPPDPATSLRFSGQARTLIDAGVALYRRAAFLDAAMAADVGTGIGPARAMQQRLAAGL